jgi:hypothetical protein
MSKASKIISIAAILLLVVLSVPFSVPNIAGAGSCQPNVWVAKPPLGNNANPGTQARPFANIQLGIDSVCDFGTVYVAAGTYYENILITRPMTLQGSGAPTTAIDGGELTTVMTILNSPNQPTIISGFTIQNGNVAEVKYRDPAKEQVLYAGIKLPAIKMLSPYSPSPIPQQPCGGGIYIGQSHIVTLNDCVIKDNVAWDGGGICNNGQLYMNRCTVSGNSAYGMGGGIYNGLGVFAIIDDNDGQAPGRMFLTNCTISGNSAIEPETYYKRTPTFGTAIVNAKVISGDGGGIFNAGNMELLNCTIAKNSAEEYGGGFANIVFDTATFKNTIVANNTAGQSGTNNGYNPPPALIISLGHNLDSENSCQFNQAGDLINTDPLLGPLQDNGGPTSTCALPITSPAVDAGDNNGAPATDQRGVSRPQGIYVDIGAYELEGGGIPESTETHPSYSPPISWTRNLNPPTMSVQFVSINPQQATANQPVTISTNVVNTGDQGGNMNVTLKINGQVEETRMVSVGPQASQPIKFTVTKAQPGTYSVDIGGQTGIFTIPGTSNHRAPVSAGLIAFIIVCVLILATVMVLLLSRRPA